MLSGNQSTLIEDNTLAMEYLAAKISDLVNGDSPIMKMLDPSVDDVGGGGGAKKKDGGGGLADKLGEHLKSAGGKITGQITGLFSLLAGKIIAAILPVAVLAAAISSNVSGFKVFLGAIQVLGSVVAMALLPMFIVLGAAILMLSVYVSSKLMPVLAQWYESVATNLIPALIALGDAFKELFSVLGPAIERLQKFSGVKERDEFLKSAATRGTTVGDSPVGTLLRGMSSIINAGDKKLGYELQGHTPEGAKKLVEREKEEAKKPREIEMGGMFGGVVASKGKTPQDEFLDHMQTMMDQMAHDQGPQTQRTNLIEASKAAQQAALQMSPFEQMMKDNLQKAMTMMQELINKMRHPTSP